MLNKFLKQFTINIQNFLDLFFFLRYLFVIFVTFTALFLTIPIFFFDYEKKGIFYKTIFTTKL